MDWEPKCSWEFGVLGFYDWANLKGKLAPLQNLGFTEEARFCLSPYF